MSLMCIPAAFDSRHNKQLLCDCRDVTFFTLHCVFLMHTSTE